MATFKIKRFNFISKSSSFESSSEIINGKPVKASIETENLNNINGKISGKSSINKLRRNNEGNIILKKKTARFSDNREDASPELIEKAKSSGVIQKVGDSWRIISIKKRKLWDAHYNSRENAEAALRGYQANK